MKFFYQSGAMGYGGEGWAWHKFRGYKFPRLPVVSKTVSFTPIKGSLYSVLPIHFRKSVWNKVGLHNPGLLYWLREYHNNLYTNDLCLSLYIDSYDALLLTMNSLKGTPLQAVELNISCPNIRTDCKVIANTSRVIETIKKKLHVGEVYLKVRHDQDLYAIDNIHMIDRIHVNSVPKYKGGISGKMAQTENWKFVGKWQGKPNIPPIAGCSWVNQKDIATLKNMGCEYMGIGSVIITNPKLIEGINNVKTSISC